MLQNLRRLGVGLLAVCAIVQIGSRGRIHAYGTGVVISQIYGAGGNAGAVLNSDYIELYNPGPDPVNLSGWSVQYASATGSSWTNKTNLSGTIQPGHYFLIQESSGTNGAPLPVTPDLPGGAVNMSGSAGKLALVSSTTALTGTCPTGGAIVDFVGFGSTASCYEGTGPTPTLSPTTAALRGGNGATDTNSNAADFIAAAPAPRNSSCTLTDGCPAKTNPVISAPPISVLQGDPVLLKVSVAPGTNPASTGIVVAGDLSAIGGVPAQAFSDDGTNGDVTAGDLVFSFAVPAIATPGTYAIPMSASDAQSRTAAPATLQLTIAPLTAIHDIQGPGTSSPLVSQKVTTRGIVTGVRTTGSKGFFIQAPDGDIDEDPNTSEGVFVYTGSTPPASAAVGNLVVVTGTVQEYAPSTDPYSPSVTEISGSPTVTLLATGQPLPAPIPITSSDLNAAAGIQKLERLAGMRVHIDELVATEPTGGNLTESAATSTSDGLFAGVLPGVARPFREPGIETPDPVPAEAVSPTTVPMWDANPERIAVATGWLSTSAPLDVTTGVTVQDLTGPLDYTYRMYCLDTERTPVRLTDNITFQAVRVRKDHEFTVATMNLERFYDSTDDPAKSDTVLTPAAVGLRLAKASMAVRTVMNAPDIIGFEEVENLDTAQALAAKIFDDSLGALDYAPYLMEGNDVGGIDVALLARKDRVEVLGTEQLGKDTLFNEPDGSTSKLNDRPSLIVHARILNAPYEPYPVTIVVNHLKAMTGIDGPSGARNRAKRLAQTIELAAKLQVLQGAGETIVSVGDYNAFDVNDGYTDIIGMLKGTEAPAEQVTLWAASPVVPPMTDLLDLAPADQRYSYVYDGNAQAIDHILASSTAKPTDIGFGRMDADFPEIYRGDASRPERLSDHDPLVGYFSLPDIDTTPPTLTLPASISMEGNTLGGATVTFTATAFDAVDGSIVPTCSKGSGALFPVGTTTVTCTAVDAHGNRADGTFTVTVTDTTAPSLTGASPSRAWLWPPNQKLVPIVIGVTVTDAVDATPACRIVDVTGTDGATDADWAITGPLTLALRAMRSDDAMDGRVYTMTVTCADKSGNVSSPATTSVTVPHDQGR